MIANPCEIKASGVICKEAKSFRQELLIKKSHVFSSSQFVYSCDNYLPFLLPFIFRTAFIGTKNPCYLPPSQPLHQLQLRISTTFSWVFVKLLSCLGMVSQILSFDLHWTSIAALKEFDGCSQLRETCTKRIIWNQ